VLGALFFRRRPSSIRSSTMPGRCSRCASFTASPPRSSRRLPRPMWPASPRPGAAPGSAGSRRRTTSAQPRGRSSAASSCISPPAIR
jgi:hypothetical protein